ncbi:fatty acid synthase-like [Pseudomyrmex gracilis]|uniref:fatty acid synthase-like n=1 Tax=Pseudomyrmex gracilis TaxID=219809 RepID=UPI000995BF9D|nr:fatty acid synthase-like [Pseudomyrmex gracilis]
MKQLQDNLFNEIDLASNDHQRWNTAEFDMPSRLGKINNIEKFDAQYFDISMIEAHVLDPMARMLLEHTYEAIIDAGLNPEELHGTNTGIFVGACFSSTFNAFVYNKPQVQNLFDMISYDKYYSTSVFT